MYSTRQKKLQNRKTLHQILYDRDRSKKDEPITEERECLLCDIIFKNNGPFKICTKCLIREFKKNNHLRNPRSYREKQRPEKTYLLHSQKKLF